MKNDEQLKEIKIVVILLCLVILLLIVNMCKSQTIPLHKGWNLVSLNKQPEMPYMATIFGGLQSSGKLVEICDVSGARFPGGELTYWQPCDGYIVKVSDTCTLTVTGEPIHLPLTVQLWAGTNNVIPYPLQSAKPTGYIFADVKDYIITDDRGEEPEFMEPGKAYIVHVEEDCVLTYRADELICFGQVSSDQVEIEDYVIFDITGRKVHGLNYFNSRPGVYYRVTYNPYSVERFVNVF